MIKTTKNSSGPTDNEIATLAYHLWEADGHPQGRDMDHWLQAKAHLIADRQYKAGAMDQRASGTADQTARDRAERKPRREVRTSAPARQPAFT